MPSLSRHLLPELAPLKVTGVLQIPEDATLLSVHALSPGVLIPHPESLSAFQRILHQGKKYHPT